MCMGWMDDYRLRGGAGHDWIEEVASVHWFTNFEVRLKNTVEDLGWRKGRPHANFSIFFHFHALFDKIMPNNRLVLPGKSWIRH